jgi:hypothetical protein
MTQQEIINELRLMESRIKILLSMLAPSKINRKRKVDYSDQIKKSLSKKQFLIKK